MENLKLSKSHEEEEPWKVLQLQSEPERASYPQIVCNELRMR
jgi:hypothetical protein